MNMKRTFTLILLFCASAVFAEAPKYIILFIGDGLSTPQRMIAEEFALKIGHGQLTINHLPNHATTRTVSANSLVTDSAASGTAIACGEKTNNGRIGMSPDLRRLESVAEAARDSGRKVGIVTTVTMNHATPASFYGHQPNRGQSYDLGLDMIASNFDFFAGGGVSKRDDKTAKAYKGDIYELAKEAGYEVIDCDEDAIRALRPGGKKVMAFGAAGAIPYAIDLAPGRLTLADYTKKALEMLDNPNGFFLMVEGGSIDWAGHSNEAATNLREVLGLDQAVREAVRFAEEHPGEVLLIVTGDHETGGMTMGFAGTGYALYVERLANQKMSTGEFDKLLKKVQKETPGFGFEDAKTLLAEYYGFVFDDEKSPMYVKESERRELEKAFGEGKLPNAAKVLISAKAGVGWTSGAHTGLPVLTTSMGKDAEKFTGLFENADISIKLKELIRSK